MYIWICVYMYVYIYTYMYTRPYIYIHLPLCTYIHQYIFVYISIYIWRVGSTVKHDMYIYIYIYIRMQVHLPLCKQKSTPGDSLRTNPTRSSRNEQSHCAAACWNKVWYVRVYLRERVYTPKTLLLLLFCSSCSSCSCFLYTLMKRKNRRKGSLSSSLVEFLVLIPTKIVVDRRVLSDIFFFYKTSWLIPYDLAWAITSFPKTPFFPT